MAWHAGVTCLIGQNAQGKTNLLESLYALLFGHSFRTVEYRHLIAWGEPAALVQGTVSTQGLSDEVVLELGTARKRHLVNGKTVARQEQWQPAAVLFSPEEVLLFKEGPEGRRDCLDRITQILQPGHRESVRQYARVIHQRNRLLKELSVPCDMALLEPWDRELARWGEKVIAGRMVGASTLNAILPLAYQRMAEADPPVVLRYLPYRDITTADALYEILQLRRVEECERRITLVGPHRDDLVAELGGRSLRSFGSQGQHRSVVLALKVAEAELYRQRDGEPPIFLLDDVRSELDPLRTAAFFHYLAATEGQVMWTATDLSAIPSAPIHQRLEIRKGTVL